MVNWLSTSPSSGSGYNTISVTALPNTGGTRNANVLINGNETSVSVSVEQKNGPYELMPMTFKIASAGTINWYHRRTLFDDVGDITIQYRINEGQWTSLTATSAGTSFNVGAGDVVEFKGDNVRYGSLPLSYTTFSGSTAVFEAYGNTMSLIDSVNYPTVENLTEQYAFNRLFASCTGLTSAENLIMPTTVIPMHVYTSMFEGCTSLTTSPLLPGIAPDNSAYNEMFKGCTSLNNVRCLATDVSSYHCTYNWLSGVSQTGTFTKAASMAGWGTGNDGIPSGWTIMDYSTGDWLSLSRTAGTNNAMVILIAEPNTGNVRTHTFTVNGNMKSETISITQAGGAIVEPNYLTFKIRDNGHNIMWKGDKTIYYSLNGGSWSSLTNNSTISVSQDDIVKFRGDNSSYSGCYFSASTAEFDASGNIMSLISSTNFDNITTIPSDYCFNSLFADTNVVNAGGLSLPAATLTKYCYRRMFRNCSSLTKTPYFAPLTVDEYSCQGMFSMCTSLTETVSVLPAKKLVDSCYKEMYYWCRSLLVAPNIQAKALASQCCWHMFEGCTAMETVPSILPAKVLADYCYAGMFSGCTSITAAPELPSTDEIGHSYDHMFEGCSSLNHIKCLGYHDYIPGPDPGYGEWVLGVAENGTFIKRAGTTWVEGKNGIPSGWTVYDYYYGE